MIPSRGDRNSLEQMSVDDVLKDLHMKLPLLLLRPMGTIRSLQEVPSNMVIFESLGQSLSCLLVLVYAEQAHNPIR